MTPQVVMDWAGAAVMVGVATLILTIIGCLLFFGIRALWNGVDS